MDTIAELLDPRESITILVGIGIVLVLVLPAFFPALRDARDRAGTSVAGRTPNDSSG